MKRVLNTILATKFSPVLVARITVGLVFLTDPDGTWILEFCT